MTTPAPDSLPEFAKTRVTERPDGFYWQDAQTKEWFGPFPTLLAAEQDMEYDPESDYEPGETLQEAEAQIGMADWIDPDTGEPAEESPHHIEDH